MSTGPAVDLAQKGMDIAAMFRRSVARTPERDALVDLATGERFTYAALDETVAAVANGLLDAGVAPGDHVAVCMANRPEHVVLYLATQRLGGVSVPFNFRLPSETIRYHLEDSEADAFAFGAIPREEVAAVIDEVAVDPVVYVGEDPPADVTPYASLTEAPPEPIDVERPGDEMGLLLYTSGTTGDPKGVPIGRNQSVLRSINEAFDQQRGLYETMLGIMPLYHTVGLEGNLGGTLGMSGTYVCQAEFDPATYVEAIEAERVTGLNETPAILRAFVDVDGVEDRNFESVELVSYAGAPMSSALFERVLEVFEPRLITNLFGATEAFEWLDLPNLIDSDEPVKNGPGNLLHETRIVELGTQDPASVVGVGEIGEMAISMDSPVIFSGYWKKPEATAANVHDGWFFTGDMAHQDEDGYIYAVGRIDDRIISGGENIAPAEVEDVLATHEDVADVAVVGVPDEEWGAVPKAYVELRRGVEGDLDAVAETLDRWCRESPKLADFKRPRHYQLIQSIPRNPSGKIVRSELPDRS